MICDPTAVSLPFHAPYTNCLRPAARCFIRYDITCWRQEILMSSTKSEISRNTAGTSWADIEVQSLPGQNLDEEAIQHDLVRYLDDISFHRPFFRSHLGWNSSSLGLCQALQYKLEIAKLRAWARMFYITTHIARSVRKCTRTYSSNSLLSSWQISE